MSDAAQPISQFVPQLFAFHYRPPHEYFLYEFLCKSPTFNNLWYQNLPSQYPDSIVIFQQILSGYLPDFGLSPGTLLQFVDIAQEIDKNPFLQQNFYLILFVQKLAHYDPEYTNIYKIALELDDRKDAFMALRIQKLCKDARAPLDLELGNKKLLAEYNQVEREILVFLSFIETISLKTINQKLAEEILSFRYL